MPLSLASAMPSAGEMAKLVADSWKKQTEKPFPEFDPKQFEPVATMLKYKAELVRLHKYVENWHAERGNKLPDWPKIYFAPFEAWSCYFMAHPQAQTLKEGEERDEWIALQTIIFSSLCPWRYTQGIYRYEPSFAKAICESSLEGEIPSEILLRLPQWSIYVETPKYRYGNLTVLGFWVHLQNTDQTYEKTELSFLFNCVSDDGEQKLKAFLLPIEHMSLRDLLKQKFANAFEERVSKQVTNQLGCNPDDWMDYFSSEEARNLFYDYTASLVKPAIAMLLYLCTTEPDIVSNRQPGAKPTNNFGKRLKNKFRLFPADGPHIWRVGQSMEEDLAQHYHVLHTETPDSPLAGKRRSVRSHVRSAHWHGYWRGKHPKDFEKDMREFIFHWIPPLIVRGSRAAVRRSGSSRATQSQV